MKNFNKILLLILVNVAVSYAFIFGNKKRFKLELQQKNDQTVDVLIKGTLPFVKNQNNEKFKLKKLNLSLMKYHSDIANVPKHESAAGSGYLEYNDGNLIVISAAGVISYFPIEEAGNQTINAKVIFSNFKDLIQDENIYHASKYGIKDALIDHGKIYLSYSHELKPHCYNTSIIVADFNYTKLTFEDFFIQDECVGEKNQYGEYHPHQSGGRMVSFKNNQILYSTGDYRYRDLAQDDKSLFGKIIAIDKKTKKATIISKGHRDPQGLFYDIEKNTIVLTEHGPKGGDEININDSFDDGKINNYGWPISSYGEHYGFKKRKDKHPRYIKAPLYKSHKKYGFVEPIKYYTPSIAISELVKVDFPFNDKSRNNFLIGALGNKIEEGDLSLHYVEFDENYKNLLYEDILKMNERIRDMIFIKEKKLVVMYMESTSSIGILKIDQQ